MSFESTAVDPSDTAAVIERLNELEKDVSQLMDRVRQKADHSDECGTGKAGR